MGQTVYVDLFFLINFSMDFLCFFLSNELIGGRFSLPRALLASVLGGIYANVSLFVLHGGIAELAVDLCVCVIMCALAFYKQGSLIAHTCVYIAISTVLGGFMTALFSLFNKMNIPLYEVEEDGIGAWLIVIFAVISGACTLFGGKFFRRKTARRYVDVQITLGGASKRISAFCDSGNLLRDPISGNMCVIVDADALRGVLPENVIKSAESKNADTASFPEDIARRIRLIPVGTATGRGMLLAIRADRVYICDKNKKREVNALVALCKLEKNCEGCEALVPSELMI